MAVSSKFQCPFCERPYWRLEGGGTTGLRYHLTTTGNCRRLPSGFSDEAVDQIIDSYRQVAIGSEPDLHPPPAPASVAYATSRITVGSLVATRDQHSVGRFMAFDGTECTVKIFLGPDSFQIAKYPVDRLARYKIPNKSRVYLQPDKTGRWQAGHILGEVSAEGHVLYKVGRSGAPPFELSETEVEVLSTAIDLNPSDALASGAIESQRVHEKRKAATDSILDYRARGHGMTGLLSSSIRLVPHQIEVVRRIMSDPIQRYMLADEVGLGKTIEMGAVLRQIFLDNEDEQISIVVPRQLVNQWTRELQNKFHFDDFPGQWEVMSYEKLSSASEAEINTLVIDEAHNFIKSVLGDGKPISMDALLDLAKAVNRLFLLSATPVIADDPVTLHMLHLLDRSSYPLEATDEFRKKVVSRQEIGRLMLGLNTGTPRELMARAAGRLIDLIPEDAFAREAVAGLQNAESQDEADRQVRSLKRHVGDTYRLHQRLLRSRRVDLPDGVMPTLSTTVEEISLSDPASESSVDIFSTWLEEKASSSDPAKHAQIAELMDCIGSGDDSLDDLLKRLGLQDEPLQQIATDSKKAVNRRARVQRLVALTDEFLDELADSTQTVPKLVAFSSSTAVAGNLAAELRPVIGPEAVFRVMEGMSEDDIDDEITGFDDSPEPAVLVCDQTGEEGLNLEFAHGIIHLDVPLSAARLQQRIGRLDRFGRSHAQLDHRVILISESPGNPWLRWYNLVRDGFELFNKPVSDVQFILQDLQAEILEALANDGPDALVRMTEPLKDRLANERIRLDEQYALDSMVLSAEEVQADAVSIVEEIQMADVDELARPISEWLTEELGLTRRSVPGRNPAHTFKLALGSRSRIRSDYADIYLSEAFGRPVTRFREIALAELGTRLIRPGAAIVDGTASLLKVDERGKAFTTWRMFPAMNLEGFEDHVVFRLSYHIEVDDEILSQQLQSEIGNPMIASVVRRADTLFPPISETINVGVDLTTASIPDPLREVAAGRYDPDGESDLWRDIDLLDRTEILDAVIDPATLQIICSRVSSEYVAIWSKNSGLSERVNSAKSSAELTLRVEIQQLERRRNSANISGENGADGVEKEIRINEAIASAIASPKVILESMGLIVISGRIPSLPPEARAT